MRELQRRIDESNQSAEVVDLNGLTEVEAEERHARGLGNAEPANQGRTIADIVRANSLNTITVVLFTLGALLMVLGRFREGFVNVGFIVAIIAVSSVQEIVARRRLDKITLLATPMVVVRRDGHDREVRPDEVVSGDLMVLATGDQLVADATLRGPSSVDVDESLLTGESDPVTKMPGDELLSGSFCAAGSGVAQAGAVGEASYANTLSAAAQEFTTLKTPLQRLVDVIIEVLMVVAAFFGILFLAQGAFSGDSFANIVQVAAVTASIIPVGLFLIFAVTYSVSAARLTRQALLVQQLNSIEMLSRVDLVCTDKTGTLTANRLVFAEALPLGHNEGALEALGDFVHSSAPNATVKALATGMPGRRRDIDGDVKFTSARKWSALSFGGGTWVLGAPEMVGPLLAAAYDDREVLQRWTAQGRRVLLFAGNPNVAIDPNHEGPAAIPPLTALALVSLTDELRPEALDTVTALQADGVAVKVISGDHPETVAALARQAGFPDELTVIAGPDLAGLEGDHFTRAALEGDIFGRITPDQKERLVDTYTSNGRYVAMIGDGVNDTLALKRADVGIAMESGSSATRAVADLVLLGDSFSAIRPAIDEGRKVIAAMRDILSLSITRSATLAVLAVAIMIINQQFPFSPGSQTIYGLITITVPTLAITLMARPDRSSQITLGQLAAFVVPVSMANLLIGIGVFSGVYLVTLNQFDQLRLTSSERHDVESYLGFSIDDAGSAEIAALFGQTSLIMFLVITGLLTILFLQPPIAFFTSPDHQRSGDRRPLLLVGVCGLLFTVVMTTGLRQYLGLAPVPISLTLILLLAALLWVVVVRLLLHHRIIDRLFHLTTRPFLERSPSADQVESHSAGTQP